MAVRNQKSTQARLKMKARNFNRAVRQLGKNYPELSEYFALTKAHKKAPTKRKATSAKAPVCLAWGTDPVTGKRICIRWG